MPIKRSLNVAAALAAGRVERRLERALTIDEWAAVTAAYRDYDPLAMRGLCLGVLRRSFRLCIMRHERHRWLGVEPAAA